MNYISLNGKKSLLIKGLLISELPPITKPLVRTKTEEIDGRDGDIVTKLGYAAYDKKMTIGLFGDYNIDDIIEYFDSEGIVVFSNEPDKYYRYQILQQIDFERLIRFRTATVVFHVQPFKFSSVDDTLTIDFHIAHLINQGYDETINGVRLRTAAFSQDGLREMYLNGTATEEPIEFYVPIFPITLKAGQTYQISNRVNGSQTNGEYVKMSFIRNTPTQENTAGGHGVTLEERSYFSWEQSENKTYNYLYVKVNALTSFSLYFIPDLLDIDINYSFINRGNVISRPTITIYGGGTITLNDSVTVMIDNGDYITLDCESLNAYKDGVLKNRQVSGDLKDLRFEPGRNEIEKTGTGYIDKMVIERYSRWI